MIPELAKLINLGKDSWLIIGIVLITYIIYNALYVVYELLWKKRSENLKSYISEENKETFALVTGATGSLGKCFCEELANAGYNIIAIAKNEAKLESISTFLKVKYNIKIKCISIDFLNSERDSIENIFHDIKDLDVGVIVNNVGINTKDPLYLHELSSSEIDSMLHVNIFVTTIMTSSAVKYFKNRAKKLLVINVSSSCGLIPTPLQSVYGASKSYICNFTEALIKEYRGTVDFLNVAPGSLQMLTNNSSKLEPDRHKYIKKALKNVGVRYKTNPFWLHSIMDFLGTTFLTKNMYTNIIFRLTLYMRKSALNQHVKVS